MGLVRQLKNWFARPVPLIDETLWHNATYRYQFMRGLTAEENRRLRLIASDFLARKSIVGAADFAITPKMKVEIAAQACILVLELGVDYFDGWSDIIIYPGQFRPVREVVDEIGLVHTTHDTLAGEAWLGGPVVLSYADVARVNADSSLETGMHVPGFNVVIHEFAHKLDMLNGDANGYPPLHKGMSAAEWQTTFKAAYLDFCARVDHEDEKAERSHYFESDLRIDPYASESPAEFFAVASETFFDAPDDLKTEYPDVYRLMADFYRQDPARRQKNKV